MEEIKSCKDYFTEYNLTHTEEETIQLIKDIINEEPVKELPEELSKKSAWELSEEASNVVLDKVRENEANNIKNGTRILELISIIVANNTMIKGFANDMIIKRPENNKRVKGSKNNGSRKTNLRETLLKRLLILSITALVGAVTTGSCHNFEDKKEIVKAADNKKSIHLNYINANNLERIVLGNYLYLATISGDLQKQVKKEYKKIVKLNKKINDAEKQKVLYDFREFKTVDDILKRQKELENLGLTDEDKLYKDCKLSAPLQWFIREQTTVSRLQTDIIFATASAETMGEFNSSGLESYNPSYNGDSSKASYDIGYTQQNTNSSLIRFCEKFGIDYTDEDQYRWIYKLMRDNDYVNTVSCCLEYRDIADHQPCFDAAEYAGNYNGGQEWRTKKISRAYVVRFEDSYYGEFTKYHTIASVDEAKETKKKSAKLLKKFKRNNSNAI